MSIGEIVDSETLERFIQTFWGYGNFDAPLWVIGMEESCGKDEFPIRIDAWHRRGERQLDDAAKYHKEIGVSNLFESGAKLQRTWSKLIKIYLAAYGQGTDTESARKFQIECLGRSTSSFNQTCLIELMPLPSPSTKDWLIDCYTNLEYLKRRDAYIKKVSPYRVQALKDLIAEYRPKAVVFYGLSYLCYWKEVSGKLSNCAEHDRVHHTSDGSTEFFAMPHPVSHGVKNDDFIAVGGIIHDLISGNNGIAFSLA